MAADRNAELSLFCARNRSAFRHRLVPFGFDSFGNQRKTSFAVDIHVGAGAKGEAGTGRLKQYFNFQFAQSNKQTGQVLDFRKHIRHTNSVG